MLLTVNTDGNSDEAREIATLKRYGVDGFLYAKMSNRFTDVPKPLHDYPLVLVDATDRTGRYASIEPDETLIGYDATKRLIDACCASIAYIGCSEPMLAQQGRLEGYRRALLEAGMPFDESLVVAVPNNGPALQTVTDLFERRRPDGYFCFNDAAHGTCTRTRRDVAGRRPGRVRDRCGQPPGVRRGAGAAADDRGAAAL